MLSNQTRHSDLPPELVEHSAVEAALLAVKHASRASMGGLLPRSIRFCVPDEAVSEGYAELMVVEPMKALALMVDPADPDDG